ncbi:hypothetical protein BC629DRAFT_1435139 [Irpex lacteus]|nr:hypothetical protein BC629DRAFT_1435139 [Irpex lacteus]
MDQLMYTQYCATIHELQCPKGLASRHNYRGLLKGYGSTSVRWHWKPTVSLQHLHPITYRNKPPYVLAPLIGSQVLKIAYAPYIPLSQGRSQRSRCFPPVIRPLRSRGHHCHYKFDEKSVGHINSPSSNVRDSTSGSNTRAKMATDIDPEILRCRREHWNDACLYGKYLHKVLMSRPNELVSEQRKERRAYGTHKNVEYLAATDSSHTVATYCSLARSYYRDLEPAFHYVLGTI